MEIKYICNNIITEEIKKMISEFSELFNPVEDILYIFDDAKTHAIYCECHIYADKVILNGTVDSPLDADNQPDYRANRDVVEDSVAFLQMKDDAIQKRSFSNIVAEYTTAFDEEHPLKIIGGQHRFMAISEASEKGINQYHGLKVYFGLSIDQRLDVQLISNTNIAVSSDLLDRMLETVKGPQLRDWCQKVGLLNDYEDFADRKQRNGKITVRAARTFIMNYYKGLDVDSNSFPKVKTMPVLAKTGGIDDDWEQLKSVHSEMWENESLIKAGKEFAKLVMQQRAYYSSGGKNQDSDFADKAMSLAVLAAWAYVAGCLQNNIVRLNRHFELSNIKKTDPLNAKALAKARHKTDPDNYRGLGTRTDVKERGRLTELFYFQAEKGTGITKELANAAIAKYYAKQAVLEAEEAAKKV